MTPVAAPKPVEEPKLMMPPATHMLAGAHDEEYERSRDWLDYLRNDRRIT